MMFCRGALDEDASCDDVSSRDKQQQTSHSSEAIQPEQPVESAEREERGATATTVRGNSYYSQSFAKPLFFVHSSEASFVLFVHRSSQLLCFLLAPLPISFVPVIGNKHSTRKMVSTTMKGGCYEDPQLEVPHDDDLDVADDEVKNGSRSGNSKNEFHVIGGGGTAPPHPPSSGSPPPLPSAAASSSSSASSCSSSSSCDEDEEDDDDQNAQETPQPAVVVNPEKEAVVVPDVVVAGGNEDNCGDAGNSGGGGGGTRTLLVLISSQPFGSREVAARQDRALAVLESNRVAFQILDGADPANRTCRDDLFTASGLPRGTYPQFFVITTTSSSSSSDDNNDSSSGGAGTMTFWGDYDRLHDANETGSLAAELGVGIAADAAGGDAADEGDDKAGTEKPVTAANADADGDAVSTFREEGGGGGGQRLLVLTSSQPFGRGREVAAKQERAFAVLDGDGIPYEKLDGADAANRDRRNGLFGLSGVRGEYPQFFRRLGGGDEKSDLGSSVEFLGCWNWFETANETGTLVTVLGSGSSSEAGKQEIPSGSATSGAAGTDRAGGGGGNEKASLGPLSEQEGSKAATGSKEAAAAGESTSPVDKTDITVYGATSFVARHVLNYLRQVSLTSSRDITVTLAGRNPSKMQALCNDSTQKMNNLCAVTPDATGKCLFDVVVAESSDTEALNEMAKRTKVVISCAGPFVKYSSNVVAACAKAGTDYVDITGEVKWAAEVRRRKCRPFVSA